MAKFQIPEELQKIVQQIMDKEGVKDFEIEVEGLTEKGGGFLADMTFFKVTPNGGKPPYNLVLKSGKKSEELRSSMPAEKSYQREVYIYKEVFPTLKKFLTDKNCDVEIDYVPKIYWNSGESMVLENLKSSGYSIWPPSLPMDMENALYVMRLLGKHHGICLAFRDQRKEELEQMVPKLTNVWNDFSEGMDANVYFGTLMKNVLRLLEKNGRCDLAKKFEKFSDTMKDNCFSVTEEEDRLIVCHADCWIKNVMIKLQELNTTKAEHMYLIDFQMTCMDTPVNDLSLFIYSACDITVLDRIEELFEIYYAELSKTMKCLGSDPEPIFSYKKLKEHWTKYSRYGLGLSVFSVKMQMLEDDEIQDDLSKIMEEYEAVQDKTMRFKHEDLYNKRMIEVFTHYGDTFL